jgi:hypothetical protein
MAKSCEHMKEEMTVDSRKVHREIIGYWSQITIRA